MSELHKLSEVAELTVGYVGTMEKEYSEEGVLFLRSLNINPFSFDLSDIRYIPNKFHKLIKKSELHTNDVVIVRTGVPGTCAVVPPELDGCNCADLVIVKPNIEIIDPYYLCAFINSWGRTQVSNVKVGAIQKHFNVTSAAEMLVPIIDIKKQRKIAKILTELNDKISNNISICHDLETLENLLYNHWFVQFDFPDKDGKPYKQSGGKMVWNEVLKREIPEGWEVKPVLDTFNWIGTSQPPKSTFKYEPQEGYVRFIQNRDYDGDDYLTFIPLNQNTRTCTELDIMMDKYGDAGKTRYGIAGAYNVALSKIDVHESIMREYIRSYLSSETIYNYLHSACIASTRASLNEANFNFLSIVIPPKTILEKYNLIANNFINKILDIKKENQELSSIRNYILPMLMNGQISI